MLCYTSVFKMLCIFLSRSKAVCLYHFNPTVLFRNTACDGGQLIKVFSLESN